MSYTCICSCTLSSFDIQTILIKLIIINFNRFPNADDTACNAWKGGDQPVLKFLAGIGTEVGIADVVDFTEVGCVYCLLFK